MIYRLQVNASERSQGLDAARHIIENEIELIAITSCTAESMRYKKLTWGSNRTRELIYHLQNLDLNCMDGE